MVFRLNLLFRESRKVKVSIHDTLDVQYMEEFEIKALNTAPNAPTLWKRFVDDTFVVIKKCHQEEFFHHINTIEDSIQFTAETTQADGTLPFLDVLVIPQADGSISTAVYRKTYTYQSVPPMGQPS